MGAVYLAEETSTGRRVALKVLAPELARDERFRRRFLRETELQRVSITRTLSRRSLPARRTERSIWRWRTWTAPTCASCYGVKDGLSPSARSTWSSRSQARSMRRMQRDSSIAMSSRATSSSRERRGRARLRLRLRPRSPCFLGEQPDERAWIRRHDRLRPARADRGRHDQRTRRRLLPRLRPLRVPGRFASFDRESGFPCLRRPEQLRPRLTSFPPEVQPRLTPLRAAPTKAPDDRYATYGELTKPARTARLGRCCRGRRRRGDSSSRSAFAFSHFGDDRSVSLRAEARTARSRSRTARRISLRRHADLIDARRAASSGTLDSAFGSLVPDTVWGYRVQNNMRRDLLGAEQRLCRAGS